MEENNNTIESNDIIDNDNNNNNVVEETENNNVEEINSNDVIDVSKESTINDNETVQEKEAINNEDVDNNSSEEAINNDTTDLIAKKIIEILESPEYNLGYIPSAFCAVQLTNMFKSGQMIKYVEELRSAVLHGQNNVIIQIPLNSTIDIAHIVAFCNMLRTLKYRLALTSNNTDLAIQVEW